MAAWPNTLPQVPLAENYQEQPQNAVLRSSMDAGAPKQRARFTAAATHVQLAWRLTDSQLDDFQDFWDSDLAHGALVFQFPHPRTGTTVDARFMEPFVLAPASRRDLWTVTAKIEILP